jgi:hypothetical protein
VRCCWFLLAAAHLAEHLRRLGESNAVVGRKEFLASDTALAAGALYQHLFAEEQVRQPRQTPALAADVHLRRHSLVDSLASLLCEVSHVMTCLPPTHRRTAPPFGGRRAS